MKYFKFIILFFFIYLFLVFPFVGRPLVVDEVHFARYARVPWSFANLGPGGHPTFYIDILSFLSQVFGVNGSNLRIVGILCFLLNLVLIYKLSQEIFKNKIRGILASLIFALHPMAIQGSMILDIDNTVLTVLLMFTCLYYARNIKNFNLNNCIFLTLLFFACLWAKLGTPFILMASLILFHIFKGERKRAIQIFFISMAAILLFLLVWKMDSVICNFHFSAVFGRVFSVVNKGLSGVSLPKIQELLLRMLRITLWIGPYFIFFWVVIIVRHFSSIIFKKEQLNFNHLLIIYSISIFVFYILIGGTMFGFARYQYPMLPILSIIIANAILSLDLKNFKKYFILYGILGIVFVFVSNIFCGDLLYQVNYVLRKIAIFSPQQLPIFYKDFAKRMILYFLPFILGILLIRLVIRKEAWLRIFSFVAITFILLNNFSFDLYLRGTKYFTTYCYGRDISDFKRTVEFCKGVVKKNKKAIVIGPEDVLYAAGIDNVFGYETFWNNRDKFLQIAKDKRVTAIIYNLSYNALFSYRQIFFNPAVKTALKKDYELVPSKNHTIWIRK
ncbi:MAG: glycosyltransferase family 39 protein [Candidatus Omnitrophica bacterium]|nr:glycosyltransferase family 39 protein [Candidatus Omnitrophota bacterium]